MAEASSTTETVYPQQRNRFCYNDVPSLVCAILRWKERNPQTVVISVEYWGEEDTEHMLWCELTHISPYES